MNADWNIDLLLSELKLLDDNEFDLSLLGFEDSELEKLLEDNNSYIGLTDEDDCPDLQEEAVSVNGDIWHLDNHRLLCGDSTDQANIILLLNNSKADMCFTDPPYLMDFTGGIHADGSKSHNAKHGRIKNDKMSKSDGDAFLDNINKIIKDHVGGAFYISFYRLGISRYYNSLDRSKLQCRNLIIWDKGNHTLSNSDYKSMYEPIFYGWIGKHNFYGGKGGMDIWRIPRTAKNDLHPTMKPVELVEKAIIDSSKQGDIVLDLFCGSGTTLIACEKNKRSARLVELEPKYVDVAIRRWQEFSGKEAFHAASGKSFNEVSHAK